MLKLYNSCALSCNFPKAQDDGGHDPRIRCSGGAGDLGRIRYGDAKRVGSLGRDRFPSFLSDKSVSLSRHTYTYIVHTMVRNV